MMVNVLTQQHRTFFSEDLIFNRGSNVMFRIPQKVLNLPSPDDVCFKAPFAAEGTGPKSCPRNLPIIMFHDWKHVKDDVMNGSCSFNHVDWKKRGISAISGVTLPCLSCESVLPGSSTLHPNSKSSNDCECPSGTYWHRPFEGGMDGFRRNRDISGGKSRNIHLNL